MNKYKYRWLMDCLLLLALFGIDQWTKNNMSIVSQFLSGWIHIQPIQNTGVVLGYLNDVSEFLNIVGVNTLGAFLILCYLMFFYLNRSGQIWVNVGTVFLFSGILGNWYDRFFKHYVLDFLVIDWFFSTPFAFNLADVFIWIGFFIILSQASGFNYFIRRSFFLGQNLMSYSKIEKRYRQVFMLLALKTGFLVFVFSYSFLKVTLSLGQFNIDRVVQNQILNFYWLGFSILFVFIFLIYWLVACSVIKNIALNLKNELGK